MHPSVTIVHVLRALGVVAAIACLAVLYFVKPKRGVWLWLYVAAFFLPLVLFAIIDPEGDFSWDNSGGKSRSKRPKPNQEE